MAPQRLLSLFTLAGLFAACGGSTAAPPSEPPAPTAGDPPAAVKPPGPPAARSPVAARRSQAGPAERPPAPPATPPKGPAAAIGEQWVTTTAFLDELAEARVKGPHLPSRTPLYDKVADDERSGVTVQNPWGGDGEHGAMHVRVRKTRSDWVFVDLRDCLVVPTVGAATFSVDVLPHSKLVFAPEYVSMGLGNATLKIVVTAGGEETVLWSDDRRTRSLWKNKWEELELPLDRFAGKTVDVRFEVDNDRLGDNRWERRGRHRGVGLFAMPRILTRLRARDTDLRAKVEERLGDEMNHNVVMVFFDSMRADLVPPVREERKLIPSVTPKLDEFFGKSVRFSRAFSVGNQTRIGSYSFYTAVPPAAGGYWQTNWKYSQRTRDEFFAQQLHTLPQELRERGYLTGHLGFNGFLIGHLYLALDMGFDFVGEFNGVPENTVRMTDGIIEWVKKHKDQKFFLLVWYDPPHFPYVPPKGYKDRIHEMGVPQDHEFFAKGYLGKMLYGDDHFGRLMQTFEDLGLMKKTMFVVTADHGEAMDPRHSGYSDNVNTRITRHHGKTLYDEEVHVPLAFRHDGVLGQGVDVKNQVSLLSLGPTVLDLLGLPTDREKHFGRSFGNLVRGEDAPDDRTMYFEARWSFAIRKDGYKYIYHGPRERLRLDRDSLWDRRRDGPHEIFDINADPFELENLASSRPDLVKKLYADYDAHRKKMREFRKNVLKADGPTPRPLKKLPPLD